MVARQGPRVRLFTRRGYDGRIGTRLSLKPPASWDRWHYPLSLMARRSSLGSGGVANFDALHCGKHNAEVQLVAFDLLAIGGDDIRSDPLHARKARLAKLLTKACDGIQYNEHMEGEIGCGYVRTRLQARP
jgi:hypothetical protein